MLFFPLPKKLLLLPIFHLLLLPPPPSRKSLPKIRSKRKQFWKPFWILLIIVLMKMKKTLKHLMKLLLIHKGNYLEIPDLSPKTIILDLKIYNLSSPISPRILLFKSYCWRFWVTITVQPHCWRFLIRLLFNTTVEDYCSRFVCRHYSPAEIDAFYWFRLMLLLFKICLPTLQCRRDWCSLLLLWLFQTGVMTTLFQTLKFDHSWFANFDK